MAGHLPKPVLNPPNACQLAAWQSLELFSVGSESLEAHEATIERHVKAFYEVGEALKAIRDNKLYRTTHKTFEDYCHDRWQLSKTHINRSISAADVTDALTPMGVKPESERQCRPLTKLKTPEEQQAAWSDVIKRAQEEERPITAKLVSDVVAERLTGDKAEIEKSPTGTTPAGLLVLRSCK